MFDANKPLMPFRISDKKLKKYTLSVVHLHYSNEINANVW